MIFYQVRLFFILIFLSSISFVSAGVADYWYRCQALLSGTLDFEKAWSHLDPPSPIGTPRLELRVVQGPEDIVRIRAVEPLLRSTLHESSDLKIYQKIEEALLPQVRAKKVGPKLSIITHYAIWESTTQSLVGFISPIWIPSLSLINYGGGILPAFRRLGMAREARIALMQYYAKLGVKGFEAHVLRDNLPSIRLSTSLGFIREQESTITIEGKNQVVVTFFLSAENVPSR
jgi:RimJ/RimL family protein N-acetyltransferase